MLFFDLEVGGILRFFWKINLKSGKFIAEKLENYENPHQILKCVTLKHTVSDLHPSRTIALNLVTFKCTVFGVSVKIIKSGEFCKI